MQSNGGSMRNRFFLRVILLAFALPATLIATLDDYLAQHKVSAAESAMPRAQKLFFLNVLNKNPRIVRIAEIGFRSGRSADLFLSAREQISVVSFDVASSPYLEEGKEYVDARYPGRHVLIQGDSLQSIRSYAKEHPEETFDLIFINAGEDYSAAWHGLYNMKMLSHSGTVLVMNDAAQLSASHRAWMRALRTKLVVQRRQFSAKERSWIQGVYWDRIHGTRMEANGQ